MMTAATKLASLPFLALGLVSCAATGKAQVSPKVNIASTSAAQPEKAKSENLPDGYRSTGKKHAGKASFYGVKCNGGTKTASGEKLRDHEMTAAHKTLPMGTKVLVTNKTNGKKVVVRINDRGPFIKGRVIDLTVGAAKEIGMIKSGVVPCEVEVLEKVKVPQPAKSDSAPRS